VRLRVAHGLVAPSVVPLLGGALRIAGIAEGDVAPMDSRFVQDPLPVPVHVVAGRLVSVLGAFQFGGGLQRAWPRWHRRAGRALVLGGLVAAATGVWMTLRYPIPTPLQGDLLFWVRRAVGSGMALALLLAARVIHQGNSGSDAHRASTRAALCRFVAARWKHSDASPTVPACRRPRGPRKPTMNLFRTLLQPALLVAAAWLPLAGTAQAQHAGYRTLTITGDHPATVALLYPTAVAGRAVPMGPWLPVVAPGAPASDAGLKGLILLSHGTGGTELNHHTIGTRLARNGYLVAAVRHAGDNWQDRSLIRSGRYFSERPLQLSRVLDVVLAHPEWGPRIPAGRIGAVGHSAGGYSVLALAGAQADPGRSAQHCRMVQDDPVYCALARGPAVTEAAAAQPAPADAAGAPAAGPVSVPDPRIRAVVALAPMAVVFTPESLAAITVPVLVVVAEQDSVLNGRYHGGHVVAHLSRARTSTAAGAGHFAFMAQPTFPLPSAAGDAAGNPPGFDRVAFLAMLDEDVAGFFDQQWR